MDGFSEAQRSPDGEIVTDQGEHVEPDTLVSMNLWGFHRALFDRVAAAHFDRAARR